MFNSCSEKRGGGSLTVVSLIVYSLFFSQLLFFETANGSEIENRRLGAPKIDRSDEFMCDYETGDINDIYDKVKESLVEQGFSVREGRYAIADKDFAVNNPGNPYLAYYFKDRSEPGPRFTFKLQPGSAVLFVGCTPGAVEYFSWQTYAFIHQRSMVFASIGDSINHLVINTTQSGGSWAGSELEDPLGKLTAIITTADATTFSTIGTVLDEAGAPSGIINLDPVPSNRVDMINDPSLDFSILNRPVIWHDDEEREKYFSQNSRVFLIDPPSDQEFDPIPEVPARPMGDGTFEIEQPGVSEDLAKLHDTIVESMNQESYVLRRNGTMSEWPIFGSECLEEVKYCRGDSTDARYFLYNQDDSFKKKDIYVVVGTNSHETGKVAYSNIGLYRNQEESNGDPYLIRATTLSADNFMMEGSASAFGVDNNKLIAYVFARKCNRIPQFLRGYCYTVGYDEDTELPPQVGWAFLYRTYLDMTTKTAALSEELVIPQILRFRATT